MVDSTSVDERREIYGALALDLDRLNLRLRRSHFLRRVYFAVRAETRNDLDGTAIS
jgi:hypothetical protein